MDKRSRTLLIVLVLVVVILGAILIIVLSKSSGNMSNNTSSINQIKSNWTTFFGSRANLTNREKVLQNGSEFSKEIEAEFNSLGKSSFGTSINSVNLVGNNKANVSYNIILNGQEVLKDQQGQAILINNVWKVSDSTLCSLLAMTGNIPKICSAK